MRLLPRRHLRLNGRSAAGRREARRGEARHGKGKGGTLRAFLVLCVPYHQVLFNHDRNRLHVTPAPAHTKTKSGATARLPYRHHFQATRTGKYHVCFQREYFRETLHAPIVLYRAAAPTFCRQRSPSTGLLHLRPGPVFRVCHLVEEVPARAVAQALLRPAPGGVGGTMIRRETP